MLTDGIDRPFNSIESAQAFMDVLAETIVEVMKDLKDHHQAAVKDHQQRRAQAVELALFKLKTMNWYVHKTRRALNDLRILRRLILNERTRVEHYVQSQ
jgi:hypothetical protein